MGLEMKNGVKAPANQFIESLDGSIFVRTWEGDPFTERAPIVLIHDSLGCVALWRDFPERLRQATSRTVVAYDRLGFGQSTARRDRLKPSFIRNEGKCSIPSLCDDLGIGQVVLCGHSVGGGMAIEAAAFMRDRCEALVAIAAQAFVEDRTIAGIEKAQITFQSQREIDRLAKYHGTRAGWAVEAWTRTWLSPEFRNWSLDEALTKVNAPIIAIHGDNDEYGSLAHPERITRKGGVLKVIEGAGHLPHRENPDEVVAHIAQFLKQRF